MKKLLLLIPVFAIVLGISSCKNSEDETLHEFRGYIYRISSDVMIAMKDTMFIAFDTRYTSVVDALQPGDSVSVTYRGKLEDGTPAISLIYIPKSQYRK